MDIATMIAAARTRKAEQEAEAKRKAVEAVQEGAERTFSVALRNALGMRYEHDENFGAGAVFDFDGETYRMQYEPGVTYPVDDDGTEAYTKPAQWRASVVRSADTRRRDGYRYFGQHFYGDEHAEDTLLLALGERYDANHGITRGESNDEPPF